METLFKQELTFAKINLYKNYSDRFLKTAIYDSDAYLELSDEFSFDEGGPAPLSITSPHIVSVNPEVLWGCAIEPLILHKKNNKTFFYTTNPTKVYVKDRSSDSPKSVNYGEVRLVNVKARKKGVYFIDYFIATKDEQIKRHFMNPFARIVIMKLERTIKRDGDKIKIKSYQHTKIRKLGCKFFKKSTESTIITFDLKTGNFRVILYTKNKTIMKKFYTNSYKSLERALESIFSMTNEHAYPKEMKETVKKEFHNYDFIQGLYTQILNKPIRSHDFIRKGSHDLSNVTKNFLDNWMLYFAYLKRIKAPNDPLDWLKYHYPTEKFLKKNDRKLIASILDRLGINSKHNVKILHMYPSISLEKLRILCTILGDNHSKFIGNVDSRFYAEPNYGKYDNRHVLTYDHPNDVGYMFNISEEEKENVVKILNDWVLNTHISHKTHSPYEMINEIQDHFIMIIKLKKYYPDLKLRSTTAKTFDEEHGRLSALERRISKGYYIERLHDKEIVQEIEAPIEIREYHKQDPTSHNINMDSITKLYHPKLLTTSDEYRDEGQIMHHCVSSYVENERSIIVSLRYNDERVTCEFNIQSKLCAQSRYVSNGQPPEHFIEPLNMLYERIKSIPFSIKPIEIVKKPLVINGVEIEHKEFETLTTPILDF